MSTSFRPTRKEPKKEEPKKRCFSQPAFITMLIAIIVLAIILIIILILYFQTNLTRIDPQNCPPKLTGALATPNTRVASVATNCGNVANCTYTISTLQGGVDICNELGPEKCAAFSIKQDDLSNDFTMVVSSSTATVPEAGSDAYRLIA